MRTATVTAAVLAIALLQWSIPGCKNQGTVKGTSPEQHQQEMLKKSFAESKKAVAARVNGEAITMFDLYREMNQIGPQYLGPGKQRTPELDAKIRKDALSVLTFQVLALQQAKKQGVQVPASQIDNQVAAMKKQAGSEEAFREQLAAQGFDTETEFRKTVEDDALFELIAQREIDDKIRISEQDLRKRYERERADLKDSAHRQLTFEAAKGVLEQRMRQEASERKMREWENRLRKKAHIEIIEQPAQTS